MSSNENILGKGEVGSSILLCSTISPKCPLRLPDLVLWETVPGLGAGIPCCLDIRPCMSSNAPPCPAFDTIIDRPAYSVLQFDTFED